MTRSSMIGLAELEPYEAPGHDWRGELATVYGRDALIELRRSMTARGLPLEAARVEDSEQALRAVAPKAPLLPNYLNPNAAASLLTTANDYGRFLRHLVTARRHGGTPAAIVDLMTAPQVRCNEVVHWGLGAGLEDMGPRRFAWQWGDNSGFKNFYFANPRDEKAMVIFTNGDHGARVYERVIRAQTGDDHAGFLMS